MPHIKTHRDRLQYKCVEMAELSARFRRPTSLICIEISPEAGMRNGSAQEEEEKRKTFTTSLPPPPPKKKIKLSRKVTHKDEEAAYMAAKPPHLKESKFFFSSFCFLPEHAAIPIHLFPTLLEGGEI